MNSRTCVTRARAVFVGVVLAGMASVLTAFELQAQVGFKLPIVFQGKALPPEQEAVVAVEAARPLLTMGQKVVFVNQRVCRYDLRDAQCPDTLGAMFGPPHNVATAKAIEAAFTGTQNANKPERLRLQRPLLRHDTVIVAVYVMRPTKLDNVWEEAEYDVRIRIRNGWPIILSSEMVHISTLGERQVF